MSLWINKFKSEKGDILVLSIFLFIIFISFLALIVDYGLMLAYKSRMYNIANVMRDTRFTKDILITDVIASDNNPGEYFSTMLSYYARKNGYKGKITIIYKELLDDPDKRRHEITIILEDVYHPYFLSLFGVNDVKVSIRLDGRSEKNMPNIYYPPGTAWKNYIKVFPAIH